MEGEWYKCNGSNSCYLLICPAATYSFVPVNGNAITCVLTSNATCTTGNPATSNTVTMTVNPLLPVSVSIAASANPVCAGTSVTYAATPVNGGSTPSFQWKVNGTSVTGATAATYSFVPVNGNAITCVLTSNATCTTGNPATSNTVTMTVNPLLPVSVSIAASANPVCAGTSVTYSATAVNGGSTPSFQWKVNGTSVTGATTSSYSFIPASGNAVSCTLTSNATCTTGNPATSNTITMTVNPLLPVSVSIAASANPVCAGTSVTFSATPVNGGTTPSFQWKVNGTSVTGATTSSYSFIPASGNAVSCTLTSNATCTTGNPATSNSITMMVNPVLPVSVSITASANPVCAGTSVTFSATPVNGGTTPSFQWKVNGTSVTGATTSSYSFIPASGNAVSCALTSNINCTSGNPATSNSITMMINPLRPVSISITASANPVCAGTSVTFSATPVNGGTTPSFQWKVNGTNITGATTSSYSFIPASGNAVSCSLTSNINCTSGNPATSNTITMMVNPVLPVSISIAASANPVLAGTSVTFTATPVNGGTSPGYQWKVGGTNVTGATNASYAFIPVNGNTITCLLLSNATCTTGNPATSNSVTMSVTTVAATLVLQNLNVTGTQCFNATQTITVAGGSTTFTVQSGGSATMIAGLRISYLPGTAVKSGGYMHGYITTTGQYCGTMAPSLATVVEGEETIAISPQQSFFRVYPNPTTGLFVVDLSGQDPSENIRVKIYSMTGEKIMTTDFTGEGKHELSLSGRPAGIYLIHVVSGQNAGTTRIIKK
ncbi:MAG: T9SS type A sorting domain-containing protein [Bacteroidetes bacterium]|nr:T9SS type A sorting domain-containing protein [Bacteroidota bacterium]